MISDIDHGINFDTKEIDPYEPIQPHLNTE